MKQDHGARGRTAKATQMGWCKRCRSTIYPGEWVRFHLFWDVHRYRCPDPDEAASAYTERLLARREKRRAKRGGGR